MIEYISYKADALVNLEDAERRALEKIGTFIEAESKLRTPVDTGNLKRSITHKVNKDEKSVTIGSNVEYSVYVEKGTSRNRAQPYLTPSIEDNICKIKDIVEQEIKNI